MRMIRNTAIPLQLLQQGDGSARERRELLVARLGFRVMGRRRHLKCCSICRFAPREPRPQDLSPVVVSLGPTHAQAAAVLRVNAAELRLDMVEPPQAGVPQDVLHLIRYVTNHDFLSFRTSFVFNVANSCNDLRAVNVFLYILYYILYII